MVNFNQKKVLFIRYIPFILTLLISFISSTIQPPQGYAMTFSFIPLICILFWSLVIGRVFGPIQLLFIGIVTDLLMGTPLGSYLLLFSIIRFISLIVKEKFNLKKFYKNILAASLLIIIFYILNNLFLLVYYSKILISEYFLLNIIATIFLYPAFSVFFYWVNDISSIEKFYAQI